jgi:hypothetical protein
MAGNRFVVRQAGQVVTFAPFVGDFDLPLSMI